MSRVDKTITNAFYEITFDTKTNLPKNIRLTVLTGRRGATEKEGQKIKGGEHVAFHFEYSFSDYNKILPPQIPVEAQRLLRKMKPHKY